MIKKKATTFEKITFSRPPIVTVMGHVDHGKTTLLDAIRKTKVAEKEYGGITQKIGAYQVEVKTKEGIKKITFIDTPGHEAFKKMRSRGAQVTDIAVIVIDAKDGLMPQTLESLKHCQKANVPFIIALNKIDLPEANVEKVKKQLADKANVLVEGYGGEVVAVPISAKTGENLDTLLEMILLLYEMKKVKADLEGTLDAVIIESRLDKFKGPVASVILKNGTLKIGDKIYAGNTKGKIRSLINEKGELLDFITPGMPAEILGFEKVPLIGEKIYTFEKLAPFREENRMSETKINKIKMQMPEEKPQKLKIILKTDTLGSLEAISKSLSEKIEIVASGTGEITESDILYAKAVSAIVIGFNVKIPGSVKILAEQEKILVSTYQIIYLLLEELEDAAKYLNQPPPEEKILGKGIILAKFDKGKIPIAGVKVTEGRLARNDTVRIERGKDIIGNAKIISLKHGKETIDKASGGSECGIIFDQLIDFQINDAIISYRKLSKSSSAPQ